MRSIHPSTSRLSHRQQTQCPQLKLRENRQEIAGVVVEVVEAFNQGIVEVMLKRGLHSDNPPQLRPQRARPRSRSNQILGKMERAPDHQEERQLLHLHLEVEEVEEAHSPNLLNLIPRVHLRRLGEIPW